MQLLGRWQGISYDEAYLQVRVTWDVDDPETALDGGVPVDVHISHWLPVNYHHSLWFNLCQRTTSRAILLFEVAEEGVIEISHLYPMKMVSFNDHMK